MTVAAPVMPGRAAIARARVALGIILLIVGVAVLWHTWPAAGGFSYRTVSEVAPGQPGFPDLGGHYAAQKLTAYRIEQPGASPLSLHIATYLDAQGASRRALVYLGSGGASDPRPASADASRQRLWSEASRLILEHTPDDAVFVSWWDGAQRIDFFTGRAGWVDRPVAEAFPEGAQQRFWEEAAGGFAADAARLRQLARWLTMDAKAATSDMAMHLPKDRAVYMLVCLDDLARIDEIERLAGVKLPFEVRVFPPGGDMHARIASVKQWSGKDGAGGYFAQELPDGGLRAWRITSKAGEQTLFARLLPFTTSQGEAPEPLHLVYRSAWGGYLSVFEWRQAPADATT